ncbi:ATP-binding protein [Olsenella sp. YH-ols2223]|uniref:ATP-binding protein n=1 Tax=Olsenella absiana TaxID=3115222 RepID=A0ABU7R931_9ACTN
MFSPFRAPDGSQKTIAEVGWEDLAQLKDMDEGFVLEFKCSDTASVRRKIPKIVASFANSRGGWLVIGIADDTKEVTPIPRPQADFSQTVGELCRRHVSPAPPFEARFVEDPGNPGQGVALVQVGEGDFPPYVADGRVEIREGSTSGPATGGELVELYGKATRRHAEVAGFCHRTVFFPDAGPAGAVPLFDLYLYRMGIRPAEAVGRAEVEGHVAAMRACFSRQGMSCHVQHAHDSLILRGTPPLRLGEAHSAIELFGDESMKLTVPAVPLDGVERTRALAALSDFGQRVPEGSVIVDARQTLRRVTLMATVLDRYVRERGLSWRGYAVVYELENMAGVILWSAGEEYRAYARRHGALFCGTTDCRSHVRYLDDGAHDSFRARQFAGSHFFEACGLPLGSHDPEDIQLVDALLSTSR